MDESKIEKFEDICRRLHLKKPSRCRICGQYPVLRTTYHMVGMSTVVECQCGIKIPVCCNLIKMVEYWDAINADSYTPEMERRWIGKPRVCLTCLLKDRCTECAKIRKDRLLEYGCSYHVMEIEKEDGEEE